MECADASGLTAKEFEDTFPPSPQTFLLPTLVPFFSQSLTKTRLLSTRFCSSTEQPQSCQQQTCSGQHRPSHGKSAPSHHNLSHILEPPSNANDRTITAAAVLISIPGYVLGFPDLYSMLFIPHRIFTLRALPQIWRLATNFLITGPKLGMILDPYFLFTYCSNLETTAARFSQPGDFFVYLVFCCVVILVRLNFLILVLMQSLPFSNVLLQPRISARPASSSCNGSWKRGRLPLHCAARSSFAKHQEPSAECGNGGIPRLRKLSPLLTRGCTVVSGPYIPPIATSLMIHCGNALGWTPLT